MVTPPGIPKISVRTPTSPAPELSLTKPIVTKELGKPITRVSASCVLAVPVSEVRARDKATANSDAWLKSNYRSNTAETVLLSTGPKQHLCPGAHNFQPIAQTPSPRKNSGSLTPDNKTPNVVTKPAKTKVTSVDEDKSNMRQTDKSHFGPGHLGVPSWPNKGGHQLMGSGSGAASVLEVLMLLQLRILQMSKRV